MNAVALFRSVLEASWQSSLVIVLLLALRPLLGARIPASWRNVLWLLVLVRLLVPGFLLPASPVSIENLPVAHIPRSQVALGNALVREAALPPLSVVARTERRQPASEEVQLPEQVRSQVQLGNEGHERADWWRLAALVWMGGASACVLAMLGAALVLQRRIRRDRTAASGCALEVWQRCLARLSLRRAPRLVLTSAVESPALVGFFRPALLLPRRGSDALSEDDWEHVFLHELAHFRRRDHWLQILQLLAQCAHWFNPLVWLGLRFLRADRELAADEWALRRLGADRSAAYGQTLLKLLGARPAPAFPHTAIGILEGSAQMKQRLRRIVAFRPARLADSLLGGALALAMAAIVLGQQVREEKADAPKAAGRIPPPFAQEKALIAAARKGDLREMRRLLDAGADPNIATTHEQRLGTTALSATVSRGHLEGVKLLLEHGADPSGPSPTRITTASEKGSEMMTEAGARLENSKPVGNEGSIEFNLASGQPRVMRTVLPRIPDPAAKGFNPLGDTSVYVDSAPLEYAMRSDDEGLEIAKLLLFHGANAARSLEDAVRWGRAKFARLFWEAGARSVPELTYAASQSAPVEQLRALARKHEGMHFVGFDPLSAAAAAGHLDGVKFLLARGGDATRALYYAIGCHRPEVVDYLLQHGATLPFERVLDVVNGSGMVSEQRLPALAKTLAGLLEAGTGGEGYSEEQVGQLFRATTYFPPGAPPEIIRVLLDHGLDVHARATRGVWSQSVIELLAGNEKLREQLNPESVALLEEATAHKGAQP